MSSSSVVVVVGDTSVAIRRGRTVFVANILSACHGHDNQLSEIVLDRIVHAKEETKFEGWAVSGAFVSVLNRL